MHEGDDDTFLHAVAARLAPLAESTLVVDNIFTPDLEPELWGGDEQTAALRRAGERLEALDLLPAPFRIEKILPARDLRHVMRLYSLGGLSYGNLSARKDDARVLDERLGRRQVEVDRHRPQRDAGHRLRQRRPAPCGSRSRRASSRGASRWTRSSTG